MYIILFILTLPVFNIRDINNSKTAQYILSETPIISKYTNGTVAIYNDLYDIIDNRNGKSNIQVNEEALDLMLKYDIVTHDSAEKLIKRNKIDVSDEYAEKFN